MNIPDLRYEHSEVTLEHCSVLLERIPMALGDMYRGDQDEFKEICEAVDPIRFKADMLSMMEERTFLSLFETEFGKGVLVGAFIQQFIFEEEG
jgi:hypothetical protein